jgi:small subunit ribosomal protein S1
MELKTETANKNTKEFERLLLEDLKGRTLKERTIVKGKIVQLMPKYAVIDVGGKSDGLISSDEWDNFSSLKVNDTLDVLIERLEDFKLGTIVLSKRKCDLLKNWTKLVEAYKKGEVVTGVVKSRTRGGYLAIVAGSNCFLPGSAISDSPRSPEQTKDLFDVKTKMKVVSINEQRMNCIVSIKEVHAADKKKQLDLILKKIKVGDILTETDGFELTVAALNDWALFLTISIDGASAISMCHITQMSFERLRKPSDIMSVGQKIPKIKVIDIDKNANPPRIALSLKAVMPDPFEKIESRYLINKFYPGKVVRIVTYGAFVELEPKIQCLLHASEIDAFNKNINPNKKLSLGQNIKVRILKIQENKISVSLLPEEHPFDTFLKKFPEGSVVQSEVVAILDFGITLKIEGSEVIGFSHWKNLSYNPESEENLKKWKKGMKTPAKILEINKEKRKVRLGIREASGEKDSFMDYFGTRKNNQIITCTVKDVLENAIKVSPGNNETNLLITIKKNHLAKSIADCRPEIFRRGDRVSAMIINLEKKQRKVDLSIKELEIHNLKTLEEKGISPSSGKVLESLFGKVFKSKKTIKKKKDKK